MLRTAIAVAAVIIGIVVLTGIAADILGSRGAQGSGVTRSAGDPAADDGAPYPPARPATVDRVVDGDTVVVLLEGETVRVRLLNIDTPESVTPDSPVECLGPEASAFLKELLPRGAAVTLEFDTEATDRYGRMLAGVVLADGSLVNATIARAGLADSVLYGDNDRFLSSVDAAVDQARAAQVGLWSGECG